MKQREEVIEWVLGRLRIPAKTVGRKAELWLSAVIVGRSVATAALV